jgi:predicted RNase H-like nuclease
MPRLAGLDGCGPRWVFVELETRARTLDAGLVATEELAGRRWDLLAIDVPIGLCEDGPREAEGLARRRLRLGRRDCTVFNPPVRPALGAANQPEASAITRRICGRGVSIQSFAIFPKVAAVETLVRRDCSFAGRVYEFHPEVTFAEWNGTPIPLRKKSPEGRAARQALIAAAYGDAAFDRLWRQLREAGHSVPADDLADAFAGLWTAERLLGGSAVSLPDPPQVDACGIRMAIFA